MKIRNSLDCSIIINNAIRSHNSYWELIKNQEDEIMNGKSPKSFDELKNQGLAWQNNRNYGVGRSQTEQAVTDSVTDILKSISLMEIEFNSWDEKKFKKQSKALTFLLDPFLKDHFAEVIAGCAEQVLLENNRLKTFLTQIEYQAFLFGYASISRDIFSFFGRVNHIREVAFEDRTEIDNIKTWVTFDVVKARVLIKKLEELESMEVAVTIQDGSGNFDIYGNGWCKQGLVDTLTLQLNAKRMKDENGKERTFSTWDDIKSLIGSKGPTFVESNFDNIHIAKLYNLEEDGKISETYIQNRTGAIADSTEDMAYANFSSVGRYILYQKIKDKTTDEIINIVKEFSVSPSEYIQDLRGAGKFIASYSLWYNIKRNSVEDKLLVAGCPVLVAPNTAMGENVKMQVTGAFVVLPEGVQFATNQIKYDLNDHVQSLNMDKQEHNEMTFHYRPKPELTSRPTKDEVQLVGREVSKQSENRLPFKLKDYSALLTNILKDLSFGDYDEGKEKRYQELFLDKIQEELSDLNVTREEVKLILGQVRKVSINPVLQDVGVIKEALAIAPNAAARKKLTKMLLLAFGFSRKDINLFLTEEEYGHELEKAALENAAFYNTEEVVFTLGQDHITHLNTHFAKIDRVFNNVKQGEDPVKGWNYITRALSNTVQHVGALQNHPFYSNRFKEYEKIQKNFEVESQSLGDEIKKLQQQQQDQQQQGQGGQQGQMELPPEVKQKLYIKQMEAVEKIKRTNMISESTQKRKQDDAQFRQQMLQQQTDNNIKTQKELAELKKELELMKQSAKLAK